MSIRLIILIAASLLILPSAAKAQGFGKVFSTPLERQYLDRERERLLQELTEQEQLDLLDAPPTVQELIESEPMLFHMEGSVRRSDGNHTIWLNGVAIQQSELPGNARLEFVGGMGVLHVIGLNSVFVVRPGQTLNADTGEIREDYELTAEELEDINAQVLAREVNARRIRANTDQQPDDDEEDNGESQSLAQSIVEGLQLLQQSRDAQESVQSELD